MAERREEYEGLSRSKNAADEIGARVAAGINIPLTSPGPGEAEVISNRDERIDREVMGS